MSDKPSAPPPDTPPETTRGTGLARLGEDWWATIAGLLVLALVLTGIIPQGLVP